MAEPVPSQTFSVRTRGIIYYFKLVHRRVPQVYAYRLAAALAAYDHWGRRPSSVQQSLMCRFQFSLRQASLWRSELFVSQTAQPAVVKVIARSSPH